MEKRFHSWLTDVGKLFVNLSFDITTSIRVLILDCGIGGLLAIELGGVL